MGVLDPPQVLDFVLLCPDVTSLLLWSRKLDDEGLAAVLLAGGTARSDFVSACCTITRFED